MNQTTILIEELQQLDQIYSKLLKQTKRELAGAPDGSLVINNQPGLTCFYNWNKGKQTGISRDAKLIKRLARKRYLKTRRKQLQKEHALIKEMLKILYQSPAFAKMEGFVEKLAKAQLNIKDAVWTPAQIKANGLQSENPYKPEELRYSTGEGIKVRNMSEKLWGNLYELLDIPYQYEKAFLLDVTELDGVKGAFDRNGRMYKYYYPDFTLFMADGSIMIHEHFGYIHFEEYRQKLGEKFIAFTINKLVDHETFLVTYPADVKDSSRFRALLETFVLPRI